MSRTYRKRILRFETYYRIHNPTSYYNLVDDEKKNQLKYHYKTKTENFLHRDLDKYIRNLSNRRRRLKGKKSIHNYLKRKD